MMDIHDSYDYFQNIAIEWGKKYWEMMNKNQIAKNIHAVISAFCVVNGEPPYDTWEELKPEYKELELDKPKSELEEFEKFLEQFKDDEGGKESEEEEKEEEKEEDADGLEISNLMALKGILEGMTSFRLAIEAGKGENNKDIRLLK